MVTECGAHDISVFSPCGEKLRSFGTLGSEGLFQSPSGVAVDGEGNLLVADIQPLHSEVHSRWPLS